MAIYWVDITVVLRHLCLSLYRMSTDLLKGLVNYELNFLFSGNYTIFGKKCRGKKTKEVILKKL